MDTANFSAPAGLKNGKVIQIGTRESPLAVWQARQVSDFLQDCALPNRLKPVKSQGDLELDTPLYEMGITGIFTRALDLALLRKEVDIAVHSMKDVPTKLPEGLCIFAVLKRESPEDQAVFRESGPLPDKATVATGSLRRKAQWLHRYPDHEVVDLRGNVQTRMSKLVSGTWNAALFARAGLRRMEMEVPHSSVLEWMIPAPAQGAIVVIGREEDQESYRSVYNRLNHRDSQQCVEIERAFLQELEGGCTAPIGAHAYLDQDVVFFRAGLFSEDGTNAVTIDTQVPKEKADLNQARRWAREVYKGGGAEILESLNR